MAGLRKYEIDNDEWKIARHLCDTLRVRDNWHAPAACLDFLALAQVFKDATLFFSRSTPSLATVIPAMDHIDEMLTSHARDHHIPHVIRNALAIAKKTLDKYYTKSDQSEVYRIAMRMFQFLLMWQLIDFLIPVLHPRHKLRYFESARWPTDWINTAQGILREEFERSYARPSSSDEDSDEVDRRPPSKRQKVRAF